MVTQTSKCNGGTDGKHGHVEFSANAYLYTTLTDRPQSIILPPWSDKRRNHPSAAMISLKNKVATIAAVLGYLSKLSLYIAACAQLCCVLGCLVSHTYTHTPLFITADTHKSTAPLTKTTAPTAPSTPLFEEVVVSVTAQYDTIIRAYIAVHADGVCPDDVAARQLHLAG